MANAKVAAKTATWEVSQDGGSTIVFTGTAVFTLAGDVNNVMTWSATIRATGAVTYTDA